MTSTFARAALLALPFLVAACGGASSESPGAAETPTVGEKPPGASEVGKTDMVLGSADAPVTLIEYASVTCPHCAVFHETILPAIKEKYIDTGKVKLVFREFPTAPQNLSYVGSVLARCAAEKGGSAAYFTVLGSLFKTQRAWISENAKVELQKIAAQTGMDQAAFDACMQRQDLIDVISSNVKIGNEQHDVNATPTFVINNEQLTPVRTVEDMEAQLDKALGGAKG